MKRWLLNMAVGASLLLLIVAATAWVMSYDGSPRWRLIGSAHSADLSRESSSPGTVLFTTTPNWSKNTNYGFWDAWWALSESGRLTLVAQVIDYAGTLRRVYASPPSLIVDLPGQARPQVELFGRMPRTRAVANGLGFAWSSDAQPGDDVGGSFSARAWVLTVPWWLVVLLGLPIPLLWVRARQHERQRLPPA